MITTSTLITGATGFAGQHLVAACANAGESVIACGRRPNPPKQFTTLGVEYRAVDLLASTGTHSISALIKQTEPKVVYHLAALASAGRSWQEPTEAINANVMMTFNLLEAVRQFAPQAVVLVTGSSEVYGPPNTLPVLERAKLRPQNPYAVGKASVELLAGFYADVYDLKVVRARTFNHAGPGQSVTYLVPSLAAQVAAGITVAADPITVTTGNPEARRDYTDVRDVIRAYRLLVEKQTTNIFNVCSGQTYSVRELVALFSKLTERKINHQVDPQRFRPVDVPEVRGSHQKLTIATGWYPQITMTKTLRDTLSEHLPEGFDNTISSTSYS